MPPHRTSVVSALLLLTTACAHHHPPDRWTEFRSRPQRWTVTAPEAMLGDMPAPELGEACMRLADDEDLCAIGLDGCVMLGIRKGLPVVFVDFDACHPADWYLSRRSGSRFLIGEDGEVRPVRTMSVEESGQFHSR